MVTYEEVYNLMKHGKFNYEHDCLRNGRHCISLWDSDGVRSLDLYFDKDGKLEKIFCND